MQAEKGTSFEDLCQKHGIPKVEECRLAYQALTPIERALKEWELRTGAQSFPPRLDIFKAIGEKLTQEEGSDGLGLPGSEDFSTDILHYQHALHQTWTPKTVFGS